MFQGEEIRRLDEKSRVIIPTRFRHFVREPDRLGFFLGVVPLPDERCMRMYPPSEWSKVMEGVRKLASRSSNPEGFTRVFMSHSEFAELDAQNRVLVPQRLIEYARLEKKRDLVLVGCWNHIQVWNLDEWRRVVEEDRRSVNELAGLVRAIFGGYGEPRM